MTELKHLNAFVRDTVSVAEKELSESVYRKKRGNCYNIIAFQVGEMHVWKCVSSYPNTYLSLRHMPRKTVVSFPDSPLFVLSMECDTGVGMHV